MTIALPVCQAKEPAQGGVQACMMPVRDSLYRSHVEGQIGEDWLEKPPGEKHLCGPDVGEVLEVAIANDTADSTTAAAVLNQGVPGEESVRDFVPDGEISSVRVVFATDCDGEAAFQGRQHAREIHFGDLDLVDALVASSPVQINRRFQLRDASKPLNESFDEHVVRHARTPGAGLF